MKAEYKIELNSCLKTFQQNGQLSEIIRWINCSGPAKFKAGQRLSSQRLLLLFYRLEPPKKN